MNNNKKLKALVLSMVLSVLLAMPTITFAQREKDGLFGTDPAAKNVQSGGMLNQGINRDASVTSEGISNYGIGETVPVGSGIVILLGAGLGYVALKKKEDEQ